MTYEQRSPGFFDKDIPSDSGNMVDEKERLDHAVPTSAALTEHVLALVSTVQESDPTTYHIPVVHHVAGQESLAHSKEPTADPVPDDHVRDPEAFHDF